jgi:cobalt-zinc-cadmium efflux system membrane fusion protein
MRSKRILLAIMVFAGATALILAVGCGTKSKAEDGPQAPAGEARTLEKQVTEAGITVAPAAEQEVGTELVLPGRLTFDDQRVTHVFSPVTGRVTSMVASLGQHVKKGDPLAVIESPDLGSAVSDLAKAKADLEAAERDYRRQKELWEAHAAAERDFEAAQVRFRQAKAELERAEKKAQLLNAGSGDPVTQGYTLRSRIDGEVIARMANPGMEVQGQYSGGNAVELYTIGASDHLWALADVYETDLPRVRRGASVTVRVVTWPDRQFEGTVDWVAGAVDPVARTTTVRCVLENRDGLLKPEMYATMTVKVSGRKALAVPRAALFRMGDATAVFVRTGKNSDGIVKFALRPVRTDAEGGADLVPILGGLAAGEEIVTSGGVLIAGKLSK